MHEPDITPQLALWRSQFGRDYTRRNDGERPARREVWRELLAGLDVGSALEVGCNVGWNLRYLRDLGVASTWGVEPQDDAVIHAHQARPELTVVPGTAFDLPFKDARFDLVFTSGVLIHIAPADLPRALSEMYRVSRRYLVAIEYDHEREVEVAYRGHAGALWKRDHGASWQAQFPGLRRLRTGFLDASRGYDDCTYHVFEKPDAAGVATP